MASHNELGQLGEEKARVFLMQQGYSIVTCNWRYRQKEVDIIARKDGFLVIVEVRTRTSSKWEHPRESITRSKIRFLVLATDAYVKLFEVDEPVRFDVVTCMPIKDSDEWEIELIENAFTAQLE
jgi:putative endonuclease